jgi:hypothetical protein
MQIYREEVSTNNTNDQPDSTNIFSFIYCGVREVLNSIVLFFKLQPTPTSDKAIGLIVIDTGLETISVLVSSNCKI